MNTCFCLSVVLVSLCSYVSEISTTSREHSCYSDHIQRCVLGGGDYTCQTSVLDRKQRSKGSTLQWGVARHRQWTEKVQVRSQVSSVYPNVVGTWHVFLVTKCSHQNLCFIVYSLFDTKNNFFTTIRYKSLWSTANKLLDFGHISWFQFSTLKKNKLPHLTQSSKEIWFVTDFILVSSPGCEWPEAHLRWQTAAW